MKRPAYFIVLATLTLLTVLSSGCGKDNNPAESTGMDNLIIEGHLNNWSLGSGKALQFASYIAGAPEYTLGQGYIKYDGSFRLTVPAPLPLALRPISEVDDSEVMFGSVEASDQKAKFYRGFPVIFDGNRYLGYVYCRGALNEYNSGNEELFNAYYYFFDRDVTIKGQTASIYNNDFIYNYDIAAKAGWNIILSKIAYYTPDSTLVNYVVGDPANGAYYTYLIND